MFWEFEIYLFFNLFITFLYTKNCKIYVFFYIKLLIIFFFLKKQGPAMTYIHWPSNWVYIL